MLIKKFEDIIAWQKSQNFAFEICCSFKTLKNFSFKDQICRAAVAISSNIAEGFDRGSDKDFVRFLYIALSSCSEVKSMIYLAQKLGYLSEHQTHLFLFNGNEISKIIRGLIKSVAKSYQK